MALSAIYSFLADRFQAADFEGSLTINILKVNAKKNRYIPSKIFANMDV